MQIVDGVQAGAKNLARTIQMVQIRPGEVRACVTSTRFIERLQSIFVCGVADLYRPSRGE